MNRDVMSKEKALLIIGGKTPEMAGLKELEFCTWLHSVKLCNCSITLHVNCKIAVFVNFQVLTMTKTDTKVKNQVLTNILHCSVDHKVVLQAQELAPSGIMLIILSLNASIYKQSFQILAPKRVWSRP